MTEKKAKTLAFTRTIASAAADGWQAAPSHLNHSGRSVWAKGATLWAHGEITARDLDAWQMLCEAFDELDHCLAILAKHGEYFPSAQGGYQEHPALRRLRQVEGKILRYQRLFGLVPDARKKRPVAQQGVTSRKRA